MTPDSLELVSIDEYVKLHGGNISDAAKASGANLFSFRRWLYRKSFPTESASSRSMMAAKGIDLPRKPAPRRKR